VRRLRHPLARLAADHDATRPRLGTPFEGDTTSLELLLKPRVLRRAKVREAEF
jgi:hypothetical protein